jgi:hypothetical protein
MMQQTEQIGDVPRCVEVKNRITQLVMSGQLGYFTQGGPWSDGAFDIWRQHAHPFVKYCSRNSSEDKGDFVRSQQYSQLATSDPTTSARGTEGPDVMCRQT